MCLDTVDVCNGQCMCGWVDAFVCVGVGGCICVCGGGWMHRNRLPLYLLP